MVFNFFNIKAGKKYLKILLFWYVLAGTEGTPEEKQMWNKRIPNAFLTQHAKVLE